MLASLHNCDWPPFLGGITIANQNYVQRAPQQQ